MVSESFHEAAVFDQIRMHSSGVGWLRCKPGDSGPGSTVVDPIAVINGAAKLGDL